MKGHFLVKDHILGILKLLMIFSWDGILQSAGTDSTVNLWLASSSSNDELTTERLFSCPI